jgi:AraC-like DNA-binding protein
LPKIIFVRDQMFSTLQSFVDQEYVLQYCLRGDVDFRVEHETYPMHPGSALLMPPNTPHGFHMLRTAEQRYVVVHFLLPANAQILQSRPLYASLTGDARERVDAGLLALADEWRQTEPMRDMVGAGLLLEVLGLCARYAEESGPVLLPAAPSCRNVEVVIGWLHRNYQTDATLREMSELAGLSDAHFCKAFKTYTGNSPHRYLIRIRIQRARELLCDTNMTCTEIASMVGFPNPSAFSRAFRTVTGLSPVNWIKQYL